MHYVSFLKMSVSCCIAKSMGLVKELSDGVTETQILQKLWKK